MRFEIDAGSSDSHGDYATVRIYFEDESWVEIDAADAHGESRPRDKSPYWQGAKVTAHNADGSEEVVWDGYVMPSWYARRIAKT